MAIEAPFEGNVLAPSAELILNSATHRGRFAAKRLRVQSNATILAPRDIGEPPAQCGIVTPEAPPSVTIRELPMPPLVTAADAPAFLEWLFRIRQQELQQAQDAIFAVRTDASIVQAVIARFEQERAAGNWTWALMCLEMLGAMDGSAESYLISLLQTPLPPATVLEEEELLMTPREVEAAYRRPAIFSLAGRPSPAARQAVEDAAHSHPDKGLRGESIRALVHGQPASYVADLRASIQTGDQHFFDRPERRDPNFKTKVSNYLATYGN